MLINILDKYYSSLRRKNNRFQSLVRFLIREFANFIIPLYLKITRKNEKLNMEQNIIVSLTTFPDRINKIWIVIEIMLRQTILPSKIILWLAEEQFPNRENDLPKSLLYYLKKNLLDIRFLNEDLRSHKKYFYALSEYPNDIIITVDDDIFYSNDIIYNLIKLYEIYPNSVCCLRAHKVIKRADKVLNYKAWDKVYSFEAPTFSLFHTSGGGTLYKKDFFTEEVFNKEIFKEYCLFADDVWLNLMLQISQTKTVKANYFSNLLPIKNKGMKLSTKNVSEHQNDKQLKNLIRFYNINEKSLF